MRAIDDILALATARVKEQARRRASDKDGNSDRQEDAGGHQDQSERVDLHRAMVGLPTRAEVEPKVTNTLGRRRFLAGAGLLVAYACAPPAARPSTSGAPAALPALGADPKSGIWPLQYQRATAPVREAYSWAVGHESTLRFIPCYCGCGADGHTSNYSCYVQAALAGGRVILDTHGFG